MRSLPVIGRRTFLQKSLSATALLAASSWCPALAAPLSSLPSESDVRRFAPVDVSADRVIRTAVGLRPFRESGYLVKAEQLGRKLLVHNYGHGGGGISLSWGTAAEALQETRSYLATHPRRAGKFAVVGCGVIGLTMARVLQTHLNGQVTIYAKALPEGSGCPSVSTTTTRRPQSFEASFGKRAWSLSGLSS